MMNPYFSNNQIDIFCGDSLAVLKTLPGESVQTVVTSPPYWGLRDYAVEGQIGLEKTPVEYVEKMVEVFEEIKRILKADGTVWLNLGDSYCSGSQSGGGDPTVGIRNLGGSRQPFMGVPLGFKPKDLLGMPWRMALTLQADGWFLRSDIIWSKPNPMPESVQDRPTRAHEYIFLFSKSAKYFYDSMAIREPRKTSVVNWKSPDGWDTTKGNGGYSSIHKSGREKGKKPDKQRGHGRRHDGFNDRWDQMPKEEQMVNGANKRSVWTVATKPYPDSHFATFPPKLIEPCILS